MLEQVVTVSEDGRLAFVWDDELAPLAQAGKAEICRASHVEPTADAHWVADMSPVGGPPLGPFALRAQAIDAERAWLAEHLQPFNQKARNEAQ